MKRYTEFEMRLSQLFAMALYAEDEVILGSIESSPYWPEIQRLKRLAQEELLDESTPGSFTIHVGDAEESPAAEEVNEESPPKRRWLNRMQGGT